MPLIDHEEMESRSPFDGIFKIKDLQWFWRY